MVEQGQRFNTALGASAISGNVFLGSLFMQPMSDCALSVASSLPGLAATNGAIQATLRIGGRVVLQDAVVPVESVVGQGPTPLATGNLYTGGVLAGELVELIFRNTVATAVLAPGVTTFANINPR